MEVSTLTNVLIAVDLYLLRDVSAAPFLVDIFVHDVSRLGPTVEKPLKNRPARAPVLGQSSPWDCVR